MPLASPRLLVAALALAGAATTAAPASAVNRASTIPAAAKSVSRAVCTTSATDAQARAVRFTVRMRRVAPASAFGFVPQLEERAPGGKWTALKGNAAPAGFGVRVPARAGAERLVRRITVRGLRPGSRYRLAVDYLWDFAGATAAVRSTSRACTVKDLRPNIAVTGALGWQPSTVGGEVAYRVGVATTGLALLRGTDVPVVVRQGDTVLASGTYRPSAATESVLLPGRRCVLGLPVVVTLDPDNVIDDRDPADDVLVAQCVPVS